MLPSIIFLTKLHVHVLHQEPTCFTVKCPFSKSFDGQALVEYGKNIEFGKDCRAAVEYLFPLKQDI